MLDALRLSLVVALGATAVVGIAGTALGYVLARGRFRGRELLDSLLMMPLVLPPTVTGYYLIVLLGQQGFLGQTLDRQFGLRLTFNLAACIIAASVMALPLMVRAARVAFEELDPRHEIAAASLGLGPLAVLRRVSLPLARRGLWAGLVLSFARALGEFGATLMLAGNIPGRTQTLPLQIYEAVAAGEDRRATVLALLLTGVSLIVLLAAGRWSRRR